ncbi:MAG: threonine/serine exporter family protein, partial [Verrucomicrobiia bacterium]
MEKRLQVGRGREDCGFVQGKMDGDQVGELAHRALQVGRLLMQNGAETEAVEGAVVRFAEGFGGEVHVLVTYESLLVTVVAGKEFRTKVGYRLPALAVNVAVLDQLDHLVAEAAAGRLELEEVGRRLDGLEHRPPEFGRWAVVVAIGVTAGSLAR